MTNIGSITESMMDGMAATVMTIGNLGRKENPNSFWGAVTRHRPPTTRCVASNPLQVKGSLQMRQ